MRKSVRTLLVPIVGLGLMFPSSAQASVTKPSSPTVSSITSSAVKKGNVSITVRIVLPPSNGGARITGSRVFAGGKSCTIKNTLTSCTIRNIKANRTINVQASTKNRKGFGARSASVAYVTGSRFVAAAPTQSNTPTTPQLQNSSPHVGHNSPSPTQSQTPTPQASASPSAPSAVTTFNVTNVGATSYLINGQPNLTLTVTRGVTYTFEVNVSGHPFWLQSTIGAYNVASKYSTGVTNGGAQNGTITWAVPMNAPNTLYYVCEYHTSQNGRINIVNAG